MRGHLSILTLAAIGAFACSDDGTGAGAEGGGGSEAIGGAGAGGDPAGGSGQGGERAACFDGGGIDDSAPDGAWSTRPSIPSGPRQETAVVELDGLVYVLGGFTLAGITDLVEAYDPATDTWSETAPLPEELERGGAIAAPCSALEQLGAGDVGPATSAVKSEGAPIAAGAAAPIVAGKGGQA